MKLSQINWSQVNRTHYRFEAEYRKIQGATLAQRIKTIIKRTIKGI